MEEALAAYAIARTDALMGGDGGFTQARYVERKVERAEAAFDRAMTGAGGRLSGRTAPIPLAHFRTPCFAANAARVNQFLPYEGKI